MVTVAALFVMTFAPALATDEAWDTLCGGGVRGCEPWVTAAQSFELLLRLRFSDLSDLSLPDPFLPELWPSPREARVAGPSEAAGAAGRALTTGGRAGVAGIGGAVARDGSSPCCALTCSLMT